MVMLAYGGNGPVFAAVQAEDLGIERVLVPKASPTFSALGTLVANPSIDEERSHIVPVGSLDRSEEHTSELQSLMRISYAVFCLKKKQNTRENAKQNTHTTSLTLHSRKPA